MAIHPRSLPLVLCLCAAVRGQDPAPTPEVQREQQVQDEGRKIRAIRFEGAANPESITRFLQTRAGEPLRAVEVRDDLRTLWSELKVGVKAVFVTDAPDGAVDLTFVVEEPRSYDRTIFKGMRKFTEAEVRGILGLTASHRMMDVQALDHARVLEQRYWREGYYFARVSLARDEASSTLTMQIDEGPKVTVDRVFFRGNRAFPGWAPMALFQNLIDSPDLSIEPAGKILSGSIYSEDAVEEDLDKLRIYYRKQGYRDAQVELLERRFSTDLTRVDLTFRIVEGRRYKVRSVGLQHMTATGIEPAPRYPRENLLAEVTIKPGDYYDREQIDRDKRAIERYYGERGHPMSRRFGDRDIPDAFRWHNDRWLQPQERFDPATAEVDLMFQLVEGTPKKLRDVVIRGNSDTQDRVVRRKIFVYPGDTLNVTEVERSLQVLDSLRYFNDQSTLQGVRFELLPVEAETDVVDLAVDVQEGDTGQLLWGAGVSSAFGVQGRVQFLKRNFDLFRMPSSANPATVIDEIIHNKAFHGAGQELELFLGPGSEFSTYRLSFEEPDLFRQHQDTIGLRVQGYRTIRVLDSYDADSTGAIVGLNRAFSEHFGLGIELRQETIKVRNVDANAPTIVWDARGQTEVRSLQLNARLRDLDHYVTPTSGYEVTGYGEIGGGLLGAEEDFYKLGVSARAFLPLWRDLRERAHVLAVQQAFDFGRGYGDSDDLFLVERFYLGGNNLRGFDQRGVGPTQFGEPVGGEARYSSRFEYQFPLASTRLEGQLRETEFLRGVIFSDWGLLGTELSDPTFRELRLSVGFGVRLHVPFLGLPIALDLGWPLLYEQTDDRQPFFFSLSR